METLTLHQAMIQQLEDQMFDIGSCKLSVQLNTPVQVQLLLNSLKAMPGFDMIEDLKIIEE